MDIGLFSGTTVVELGHVVAAPFAANLLGDLGATVFKLEEPGQGDMMRRTGPKKNGHTLWWKVAARNKKSVTVDLRQERGQDIARRMIARADVVIENFRPGTLERWGLGWDDLHAVNPQLVMLRISGYGQEGPESKKPGFGKVGEAMSGAVYISGFPDKPPTHWGFSLGDLTTGLMGAYAIGGALYRRERTGATFDGECIDLALYQTLYRFIEWQVILQDQLGFVGERMGNRYPVTPGGISNTYCTQDGQWLTFASAGDKAVLRALEMIGGEALRSDPRFRTLEQQMAHQDDLDRIVAEWVARHPAEEVLRACEAADVVAAPILNAAQIVQHPTFLARGDVITVHDPDLGDVRMTGVVPRLKNHPGTVEHVGPALGEHTVEVLQNWLGMSRTEFKALRADGVI